MSNSPKTQTELGLWWRNVVIEHLVFCFGGEGVAREGARMWLLSKQHILPDAKDPARKRQQCQQRQHVHFITKWRPWQHSLQSLPRGSGWNQQGFHVWGNKIIYKHIACFLWWWTVLSCFFEQTILIMELAFLGSHIATSSPLFGFHTWLYTAHYI